MEASAASQTQAPNQPDAAQPPPQPPQQPSPATLGAIALILLSQQRPDVMGQAADALLEPLGIVPQAALVAFGLLWPNLEHDVAGAAEHTALGHVLRTQVAREAAYIFNAAKRLTATQDVSAEGRYLRQHLLAERGRRDAARQADKVAARHGPLIGWYSVRDDRTSAGCRAMHGHNFNVAAPPMVEGRPAYPGSVHPHCRCRSGAPHRATSSVRVPVAVGLAFSPDEPRIPAGHEGAGRWIHLGEDVEQVISRFGPVEIHLGGKGGLQYLFKWHHPGRDNPDYPRLALVRANSPQSAEVKLKGHLSRQQYASGYQIGDLVGYRQHP